MKEQNKSVTLLELLLAIVLLSIIVLGLTSIDFFSRHNVVNADVKARLQNKGYLGLEHIKRNALLAIGNETISYPAQAESVIDIRQITGLNESARLKIFQDVNMDGIRQEPVGIPLVSEDHWTVYRWYSNTGAPIDRYQLQYCGWCRNKTCNGANCAAGWEVVSTNVISFIPIKPADANEVLTDNYVDVEITTCLHPEYNFDANPDCGTPDNPQTTMRSRILLPVVGIN